MLENNVRINVVNTILDNKFNTFLITINGFFVYIQRGLFK